MVVEISKSGEIELNPGCRADRAGRLYVDGGERKCTSKARIWYQPGKPAVLDVVRPLQPLRERNPQRATVPSWKGNAETWQAFVRV